MAIDFSDFTDIGVGEETQRTLLRPIDSEMAILKHDARDGSLSILLSNGNNEKPDEIEEIKEISFAPVFQLVQLLPHAQQHLQPLLFLLRLPSQ